MARGITESDVHGAADELVADGERPTVERIRAHLGTGSPNTVVRWLETWWQGLGSRLAMNRQVRITTANVPEAVAALAGQWWTLALDHARAHADEALAADRASLLDAQETLERDRHTMQAELARLKSLTHEAQQAEQLAAARTSELERLVEQLQRQLAELGQQRDALALRATGAEGASEMLRIQLQELQDAARAERDTLSQHIRTTEDRAHAEIDRARQESKQAKQQLATSRREAALTERQLEEALDRAQGNVSELRQDLTIQQARADALEAQLAKLNDLPAALEAAWQQHVGRSQPKHPEPVRSKRSRGKAAP
ncbi:MULTISPECIES: DNA-binding protein [Xanthomonas]|uniref:DNA-binding protein n=1 Tax=Xanthomonas hortorum pv. pelargonii TaxID=453602 RepID=A0A6V7DFS6_9XANT|nr:DNA-binding protein [Xanthomonas hortorum]MCE4353203.1 DNA-binding protein [Xanthomonas hortorum pv. pelargonii]MCM5526686.1 DNA-binding protein [Xanthomonas hortorum pv. pelargonii]MCM5538593.1 DNA-binding protein [Xanthomonas hortorum pv. pelargonii]MCM5542824.1 DNA-binding protein [Xanthomonas hortorum pv. pelargonii]MCM5547085.1 DNA-binding protein [Xanthomonas hortorum pv. pelargonii]